MKNINKESVLLTGQLRYTPEKTVVFTLVLPPSLIYTGNGVVAVLLEGDIEIIQFLEIDTEVLQQNIVLLSVNS